LPPINQQIRARELRVIGPDGKQIGVLKLNEALAEAQKSGLDLIETAPKANPPVARIMDFGKFKYEQEKREREQKRKTKTTDVKEVRFSPFIAEGDYNTRIERVKEFLAEGHKVRIVVVFKGRQMGSKSFGYELCSKVLATFEGKVTVDMEPKFLGRHLAMVISPLSVAKQRELERKDTHAEGKN